MAQRPRQFTGDQKLAIDGVLGQLASEPGSNNLGGLEGGLGSASPFFPAQGGFPSPTAPAPLAPRPEPLEIGTESQQANPLDALGGANFAFGDDPTGQALADNPGEAPRSRGRTLATATLLGQLPQFGAGVGRLIDQLRRG